MMIGLTGGIATGKTTVSKMLHQAGAYIIDADLAARDVVAPGRPAWKAIREVFGGKVVQPDGTIDRIRLGAMVFKDADLRRKLEAIVHPAVRERMAALGDRYRRADPNALIVQDIPLLMETGAHKRFVEVILVYVPAPIQLQRLMQRDRIALAQARERIAAQMPIEAKRRLATIIIDNSGPREDTRKQVRQVYARLMGAAAVNGGSVRA